MGDRYHIEFRSDHVRVRLGEDFVFDPGGSEKIWRELGQICSENNTCRVLVEGFVPRGERATSEVIAAGQRTAAVPRLWMAFHLENFEPTEQSELFEVIAASKGVRVKFFAESEQALAWLRKNTLS